ncbi:MAG: hypothetical protein U9P72_08260 [Campylobacterota bacterium]|nr:hypothetical protein [Campylobacterota bacterium]
MLVRFLLLFLLFFPLYANERVWYDNIDIKIEAGIYMPTFGGDILNVRGETSFEDDLEYKNAPASYFSLFLTHDRDYTPNLIINYFNMKDNKNTELTEPIHLVSVDFDSSIATVIKSSVLNVTLYQDLMLKGKFLRVFGKPYYTGDLEFHVGLNTKVIDWNFSIQDLTDLSKEESWIRVEEFIPLPYLGFNYYLYNLIVYANVSALSFVDAKATSYQAGLDYRVVEGLYLSAGYLFEEFKAVEKLDTITFNTSGYKLSFKYAF